MRRAGTALALGLALCALCLSPARTWWLVESDPPQEEGAEADCVFGEREVLQVLAD